MKNYSKLQTRNDERYDKSEVIDFKKGDSIFVKTDTIPDNGTIATIYAGKDNTYKLQIVYEPYVENEDDYPVRELCEGGGVIRRDGAGGNRPPMNIVVRDDRNRAIVPNGMAMMFGRASRYCGATKDPTVSGNHVLVVGGDATGGDNPQFDGVVEIGYLGRNPGWVEVPDRGTLLSKEDLDRRGAIIARSVGAAVVSSVRPR